MIKSRGFTVVASPTIAIGIAATPPSSASSTASSLKPLPTNIPERIMRVLEKPPGGGTNGIPR